MAKAKREPLPYRPYPKGYVSERHGCKVSWKTYATRTEAEECAEAARWNGRIDAGLGFDFGYCAPGAIYALEDGTFEVTIP